LPTYEYACRGCKNRFETVQPITADPLTTCESCGGELRRVLFPVGIVYKGSGFYTTDYARNNGSAKEARDDGAKTKDAGESAAKKDEPAKKTPEPSSSGKD
jgi:putative FmdB family regulatory protein